MDQHTNIIKLKNVIFVNTFDVCIKLLNASAVTVDGAIFHDCTAEDATLMDFRGNSTQIRLRSICAVNCSAADEALIWIQNPTTSARMSLLSFTHCQVERDLLEIRPGSTHLADMNQTSNTVTGWVLYLFGATLSSTIRRTQTVDCVTQQLLFNFKFGQSNSIGLVDSALIAKCAQNSGSMCISVVHGAWTLANLRWHASTGMTKIEIGDGASALFANWEFDVAFNLAEIQSGKANEFELLDNDCLAHSLPKLHQRLHVQICISLLLLISN